MKIFNGIVYNLNWTKLKIFNFNSNWMEEKWDANWSCKKHWKFARDYGVSKNLWKHTYEKAPFHSFLLGNQLNMF